MLYSSKVARIFGVVLIVCFLAVTTVQIFGQAAEPVIYPDDPMRDGPMLDGFEKPPIVKDAGQPTPPDDPIFLSGDCSDYDDLTGMLMPVIVSGTTVGASNDYGPFPEQPGCWVLDWYPMSAYAPDVTYKWTAPSDGNYMISLCNSEYDNVLMLYRFTCPDEPVYPDDFLCGNEDYCFYQSKLRDISFSEGEEILIVIDGYGNNTGEFELRIFETPIPDIDSYIELQMETNHIPGLSACIVKDGEIDWTGSYGQAIIEDRIEVTETTLFMLASISKTVTGIAVMQLWEDGLFDLDEDINVYLPFSVRNPNHQSAPITFRMLATHTSSIKDNWNILDPLTSWGEDSPIPLGEFVEGYLTPGGAYYNANNYHGWVPGENYVYSNVGVALAAYLVEVISPDYDSFAQYCNENIFDPLGMDETSWYLADLNIDNIAMPYYWNGSGYTPYGHYSDPWFPSASLKTSSIQLARHLIAFMQYGQIDDVRILESETVEMMKTVQHPDISPWFGLFWYWQYFGQRVTWGHNGGDYGVNTRMFYYPEEDNGVIVLNNGAYTWEIFYTTDVIAYDLFEYAAGPPGFIAGVVIDESSNPIEHAYSIPIGPDGWPRKWDYTKSAWEYFVGGLITGTYDIHLTHPDYFEVIVEDVAVTLGETTYVNITMQSPCDYVIGDYNASGTFNISDIIDSFSKLKIGSPDPGMFCECPYGSGDEWAVAMDVNNSCGFNVADVITAFSKLKTGEPELVPCDVCPPPDW